MERYPNKKQGLLLSRDQEDISFNLLSHHNSLTGKFTIWINHMGIALVLHDYDRNVR